MADTITVAAYHNGLQAKDEMNGRERVIVSDDGTDKTVTAEVFKTYIGEISGGNAEELAVWESTADADAVTISTRKGTDESGTMRRSVTIPVATETRAGVMSSAQVKTLANAGSASVEALNKEIEDRTAADLDLRNSINDCITSATFATEEKERKEADTALAVDISAAKADIATNKENFRTAQANITQAQSDIADVQSAVQTAQTTAQTASEKAETASETASTAKTAAEEAKAAAQGASEKAQTAGETADAAKTAAETAQSTADAAGGTASEAKTSAEEAKSAAQTAGKTAAAANTAADAAKTAAEANATAIAAHGTRLAALEAPEAYTYVVAVAKADGGTITIGSGALAVKKGVNRWTLASGQEGFALDTDAKAHVTSLSLTGAKVKARATDLKNLFSAAVPIHSLHLPALDVSAVTSLENFACQQSYSAAYTVAGGKLTSLTGIEDWDVSKVTKFTRVFANHALTSIDLSRWDVGAATDLSYLFAYTVWCASRLTSVGDLSAWDVSKCNTMVGMFNGCSKLEHIGDISKWDTSACRSLSYMFFGCASLTSLDLSGWDTSKVTIAPYLFTGCSSLTELDCSGWDLRSLDPMAFPDLGSSSKLATFKLGEGWGRIPGTPTLDLSPLTKWTGDTVLTLLSLYDRTQDESLGTMTIKLSANTYTALGADNIAALTAKGYTITK